MDHAMLAAVVTCAAFATQAEAGYDKTTFPASEVLPADVLKGPGYEISDTVTSIGYQNQFELTTDWGEYTILGNDLLELRINEMAAIKKIEEMNKTDVFIDALGKAAMSPLNTAKALVTDPVNTIDQTVKGVGTFMGNVGGTLFGGKDDKGDEDELQAAIGFSSYKRQFAFQLGVDPYTTFEPLQKALDDICWTGFAGGLTVRAAFIAVPGGAGVALGAGSSAASFKETLRDKTPKQLEEMNRQKLQAMGVSDAVIRLFLRDDSFTPTTQTLVVAALEKMDGCDDRGVYVEDAISAEDTVSAFYVARRAVLLAAYHVNVAPAKRFVNAGTVALIENEPGALVGVFPADHVLWTPAVERGQAGGTALAEQLGITAREVWLPRTVSPLAMKELTADGWVVHAEEADRLKLDQAP